MTTEYTVEAGHVWVPETGTSCHSLRTGWSVFESVFGEGPTRPLLSRFALTSPVSTPKEARSLMGYYRLRRAITD